MVNTNGDISVSGLQIFQFASASQNPAITWPALPGTYYRVQFKDNLNDPAWQDFTGNVTIIGNSGHAYDLAAAGSKRFYRVIVSN